MDKCIEERINELLLWRDPDARTLLENLARQHKIKIEAIAELLAWHQQVQRKGDKYGGLKKDLEKIFANDTLWTS